MRKFKKISITQFEKDFASYNNIEQMYNELELPRRGTTQAAGHDFFAPFSFELKSGEIIKIPTGIKAYMESDEFLMLAVRSGMGINHNIRMCNQIGVIDADYYNNISNEGHIFVALQNEGSSIWKVNKGDKIIQGIFIKYLKCDNEEEINQERKSNY
ncbi:MAG: dUTP diphosphatase [Bacilli bacterium]|nr:dUTP diphosphatase [Bacilli bacterium]MDD4298031.1 dUTP diphosphatase [Bacilli bacterium]MDD4643683.1 dUTP diphosphatase [Bacilli bacterium]